MTENYTVDGQMSMFDQDSWFGKTCQEPSAPTREKTSKPSSRKSSASSNRKLPMCLCLKMESGNTLGAYTMSWVGGLLLGEYTMRSFGECPREENESHLSQILEDSVHPKYYLSERACMGILNRSVRRGKELPPELKKALEQQCHFKNEPESQGGGKGILIQNDRTGALSTLSNQSVLPLGNLPSAQPEQRWIPVKTRPMDEEEREHFIESIGWPLDADEAVMFESIMPRDGQEVWVCSKYGNVWQDTCVVDEGIGLEGNGDWQDIVAWMPFERPDPYKEN